MYYDECVIDGKLHWRNTPKGEWQPLVGNKSIALDALLRLTKDELQNVLDYVSIVKGVNFVNFPTNRRGAEVELCLPKSKKSGS